MSDPFIDVRDKRMGELSAEQTDRATELWLREQIGPREDYWYPHLQSLFRVIDRLREELDLLCVQSNKACAELRAESAALRKNAEQCRAALAELVACKDLQKRTEALHFAGPLSHAGEGWEAEYEAGRKEYLRRQPAAWEAARAAMVRSAQCRTDGRCQYAIDHGAEGLGHCPAGKCVMARSAG